MGYNFTGIAIQDSFSRDPERLVKFLNIPLEFESNIAFEQGSRNRDKDCFDIFFSRTGVLIYADEPIQISASKSKDFSIFTFMVSETSDTFYFSLDKGGQRVSKVIENEGEIQVIKGEKPEIEKGGDLMDLIFKQKALIFGLGFKDIQQRQQGYRYKRVKPVQEKTYKALFYDSSSKANNPGNMTLNLIQWIKMNFLSVLKKAAVLLGSLFLMIKLHWIFALIFIGSILYNIWYWISCWSRFKAGAVCLGKVISLKPLKIAVATDMTKMFGSYPILKIFKTRLPKEERILGRYIPTVALYNNNPFDYPFWAEFHPVPISHGTWDKEKLKLKLKIFGQHDFKTIDRLIEQVGSSDEGTYKVDVEHSGWKSFPDVKVGKLSDMKKKVERVS